MATRKRLYDLTENACPVATDYIVIDSSASSSARKVALSKLALLTGACAQDFGMTGVKTDLVSESTSGSGVTADGFKIKDSAASAASNLYSDYIYEYTATSGVRVDGFKIRDSAASAASGIFTDKIGEHTAAVGVTFSNAIILPRISDAGAPASGFYFSSSGNDLRYKYGGSTWAITVTSVEA